MKIKTKILLLFLGIGVLPLLSFMIWEYYSTQANLKLRSFEQLKAVRESRKREIEWYFMQLSQEASFFAQSQTIIQAMQEFEKVFNQLDSKRVPPNVSKSLKEHYRHEFINSVHQVDDTIELETMLPKLPEVQLLQYQYLTGAKSVFEPLPYFEVHEKYHKAISSFINTYEIYDLFLIEDKGGNIIYSVVKEIDFATSLLTGSFSDSHLGKLYRKVRYSGLKNETYLSDFERYLPSKLAPAAFIATGIFEGNQKIGTLVLQVPLHRLDQITTGKKAWKDEGLGITGETYIIGQDQRMRTDSRFMIESPKDFFSAVQKANTATARELKCMQFYQTCVLFQKINTETARKALANLSGIETITDYRGQTVFSAYAPLEIKGLKWAILAEIDTAEIYASIQKNALQSVMMLGIITAFVVLVAVMLARSLYSPIRLLAESTRSLGEGNYEIQVNINRQDELGFLANTFNQTALQLKRQREEILSQNVLLETQGKELKQQAQALKILNDEMNTLNQALDQKVKERTENLARRNEQILEYAHYNSHRLRAPVATILGLLQLIKESENTEEINGHLALLEQSVQKLDKIVHDIQQIVDKEL